MEKGFILQTSHSFLIFPITWSNFQAWPHQSHGVSLQKSHPGTKFLVILSSRMSSESPHVCIFCGSWVCWLLFPSSKGQIPVGMDTVVLPGGSSYSEILSLEKGAGVFQHSLPTPAGQSLIPKLWHCCCLTVPKGTPKLFPSCRTEF